MTKATIKFSNLSANEKAIKAQSIKDAMQASGNFAAGSMPITYVAIQALITNLRTAITAASASNSSAADTAHMHEQERILVSAFNFIKAHVEFVANNATDPASIIASAGMQVMTLGGANAVTELTVETIGNGTIQVRVPRLVSEKAFVIETSADKITWAETAMSSLTKQPYTCHHFVCALLCHKQNRQRRNKPSKNYCCGVILSWWWYNY
jgi:hypothetical protein